MQRAAFFVTLLFFIGLACKKEKTQETYTVEVVDYNTGKPIEGALVSQAAAGFNTLCWCPVVSSLKELGFTDQNGLLKGLPNLNYLVINSLYYHGALENYQSVTEKSNNVLKFYLFKQSGVKVIINSAQQYSSTPYVVAGPILKNGSMLPLTDSFNKNTLTGNPGWAYDLPIAGDMLNWILVLKRDQGTTRVDTLFKKELFIPADAFQNVLIDY